MIAVLTDIRTTVIPSYPAIPLDASWVEQSSPYPTASSSGPGSSPGPFAWRLRPVGSSVYPVRHRLRLSHLPQFRVPRISHCHLQLHCQAPQRERGSSGGCGRHGPPGSKAMVRTTLCNEVTLLGLPHTVTCVQLHSVLYRLSIYLESTH
jgi:hypothetical protein